MIIDKDGLKMADGSDVRKYLRSWMRETGAKEGEAVNLLLHEAAKAIELEIWESRNLAQSA